MQMASAPFHDAALGIRHRGRTYLGNQQIHAARVRQTAERGTALVEDLRYTLALSQRLVRASRALLKRPTTRALLPSPETESSRNGRTGPSCRKNCRKQNYTLASWDRVEAEDLFAIWTRTLAAVSLNGFRGICPMIR